LPKLQRLLLRFCGLRLIRYQQQEVTTLTQTVTTCKSDRIIWNLKLEWGDNIHGRPSRVVHDLHDVTAWTHKTFLTEEIPANIHVCVINSIIDLSGNQTLVHSTVAQRLRSNMLVSTNVDAPHQVQNVLG